MKFLPLFILFTLSLCAKAFSVATYNVENLFDLQRQGTEYSQYIPYRHNWNERIVHIKLQHVAEVLCDMDADIVGLQEIESERIFRRLLRTLEEMGCRYRYGAITHKRGAPVQVALLSRFEIEKSSEIRVSYAPKVRNILEAQIKTPGEGIVLFVNHWKSKARDGFESKRIAYAKALMSRIASLPKRTPYIVLGDFNSDYNAYLTLEKRNNDTGGRTGINTILPTMQGAQPVDEATIASKRGAGLLYDLWYELPLSKRWSQKFYGKRSTPDHILLPHAFFDGRGVEYQNGSFRVFKAPYLFTKKGYINRWEYAHGKHTGHGYSDHLPLIATFDTKPYRDDGKTRHSMPPQVCSIDALYSSFDTQGQYLLKNVAVLLKRGAHAVIKAQRGGRGIFLYGSASALHEGECYDLLVEGVKRYKGSLEISAAYVQKSYGKCDTAPLLKDEHYLRYGKLQENEVLHDIEGLYRKGRLYIGDRAIKLYFKKRRFMPPSGSKLKIAYAILRYYKNRLEIIVTDDRDFKVAE